MIKLNLDQIKELCTESSFERGVRYFEEGRVKIKEASPSRLVASVAGTSNYRVEVNLKDLSAACTCPYDWEGYCKHIVATLLAIDKDYELIDSMMEKSRSELKRIDAILDRVEPRALRNFLSQEMERLPDLKARFMACFSPGGERKSVSDYKDEVASLYEATEDHGFVPYGEEIDFSRFQDLAEIYIQKGDFLDAARIHQALSETIAEKMDNVDDSNAYYADKFSGYLKAFPDCIVKAGLDAKAKRRYIKYLFDKYLQKEPDYFQDDYDEALKTLCTSEKDLMYWKELMDARIPEAMPDTQDWSRYYQVQELISMKLYLLSKLKEKTEFYALMEKHYRSDPDLSLRYSRQLLEDGDRGRAVKIAEEGVALFPDNLSYGLMDFLGEIYKETDLAKYKETLLSLFLQSDEWKYYELLKMASSPEEWRERLDKILMHFSQDRYGRDRVIDIYLREQMYNEALRVVLATKDVLTLGRYQKDLAHLYPEQYFNAYRELIYPFAERSMGRRHYQDVVSYLKRMNTIEGFEGDVQEIVERLRKENKRKPAFIDAMKEL